MRFSDIPGAAHIKATIIQAARSGKIPHAQLFMGAEGALNLPLALAYAAYLHCEKQGPSDSCGTCASCTKSLKYVHPDTHFVFPAGNVKGDKDEERFRAELMKTWRAFLLEQPFGNLNDWVSYYGGEDKQVNISREESREIVKSLSLKAFESKYKIMIIWQPEYMHPSAANGILKILEEPPPHTVFILVTNSAELLLPTIVSRTQSVQVPLLGDEELEAWLSKAKAPDVQKLGKVIQLAEGNLNLALTLLHNEVDDDQEHFAQWMRSCFKKDYVSLVALSEEFHERDKLSQRNLLHYSLTMMREAMLQVAGATEINRIKGGELKFIKDFSVVMNVSKIERTSQWINEAEYHLDRNGSAKMIFLDLSLRIGKLIKS